MAVITKNYSDNQNATLQTWVEKVSNPVRDYLTYGYFSDDIQIWNTSSTTRDYLTQAAFSDSISIGYIANLELEDWTTEPLVLNYDFSEWPATSTPNALIPRFWEITNGFGAPMIIGKDDTYYYSSPSSLKLNYTGTAGNSLTVVLKQSIEIRDILQTKGTYRLMFRYMSDDDNITILPVVRFLNVDKQIVAQQQLGQEIVIDTNDLWKVYDKRTTFTATSANVAYLQLMIIVIRNTDGAFTFNIDDVDFHYGFSLTRKPTFPSVIQPSLQTYFDRDILGNGFSSVGQGGNTKHDGTINFNAIAQTQFEYMKAAWSFMMGHRLNISNVISHRADVTLPTTLEFSWHKPFNWSPSTIAENLFDVSVELEEL